MQSKSFHANKENLAEIQLFIAEWIKANKIDAKTAAKIAVCSDEIVSNIVFYSKASFVKIECDASKGITLKFTDDGKNFNPLLEANEPDISTTAEERNIGGLGVFMVKKMTSAVAYERIDSNNIIVIKF